MHQVHDDLPRLLALKDKGKEEELDRLARSMASAVRANCRFLAILIRCSALQQTPRDKEEQEVEQLLDQNGALRWQAVKILFWIRFRPARVRDCRSITDAVAEQGRVWTAYLQFLEQYPEARGGAAIPDEGDEQEFVMEATAAGRSEPQRSGETTRKPYHR